MEELIQQFNGVIDKQRGLLNWVFGGETGIPYSIINPTGNWTQYESDFERQGNGVIDSESCITFAALSLIACILNFLRATGKMPDSMYNTFQSMGYVNVLGHFQFNEIFTAQQSGTTQSGNDFESVWECIRTKGLLPLKDWKQIADLKQWSDFTVEPPQVLKDKAKSFLSILNPSDPTHAILWERVLDNEQNPGKITQALYMSPVQIASPVCQPWANGVIQPCGDTIVRHSTLVLVDEQNIDFQIRDTYNPFLKKLARGYSIKSAVRGYINLQTPPQPTPFSHVFTQTMQLGDSGGEVIALQNALKSIGLFPQGINGPYGEQTRRAVLAFQTQNGILNDNGIHVGPQTLAKLNSIFSTSPRAVIGDSSPPVSVWQSIINIITSLWKK